MVNVFSHKDDDGAGTNENFALVVGKRLLIRLSDVVRSWHASVGKNMPSHAIGQLGQLEAMHLPMHVHGDVDEVAGGAFGRTLRHNVLAVEHKGEGEVVIAAVGLPSLYAMSGEIGVAEVAVVGVVEVILIAQNLMLAAELDHLFEVAEDVGVLLQIVPVEPRDFIVLTIGVVVALLRVAHFIARQYHGNALTDHQQRDGVLHLTVAQGDDIGVVGRALAAAVPAVVMVFAVTVALAIGLVVLAIV